MPLAWIGTERNGVRPVRWRTRHGLREVNNNVRLCLTDLFDAAVLASFCGRSCNSPSADHLGFETGQPQRCLTQTSPQ